MRGRKSSERIRMRLVNGTRMIYKSNMKLSSSEMSAALMPSSMGTLEGLSFSIDQEKKRPAARESPSKRSRRRMLPDSLSMVHSAISSTSSISPSVSDGRCVFGPTNSTLLQALQGPMRNTQVEALPDPYRSSGILGNSSSSSSSSSSSGSHESTSAASVTPMTSPSRYEKDYPEHIVRHGEVLGYAGKGQTTLVWRSQ